MTDNKILDFDKNIQNISTSLQRNIDCLIESSKDVEQKNFVPPNAYDLLMK